MNRLELGPVAFTACWVGIWLAHAVTAAYYVTVAIIYWNLNSNFYVGIFLATYGIGIGEDNYSTVAAVHATCAIVHAFVVLHLLVKSLGSRLQPLRSRLQAVGSLLRCSRASIISHSLIPSRLQSKLHSCVQVSWLVTLKSLINQVFGDEGLLGVNGKWYGTILVAREFLELSLQTVQAYKMSTLLSATTPTDLYTGLLIGNCWITAWIRIRLRTHAVQENFFSLLLDCLLDLVTIVGLSVVIATPYIANTKWTYGGFWAKVMIGDEKTKQAMMELQFVSVSSWVDLISRVVFALGLLYSLNDMKILLHSNTPKSKSIGPFIEHLQSITKSSNLMHKGASRTSVAPFPFRRHKHLHGVNITFNSRRRRRKDKISMLVSFVFVIWGCVLLALHLYARSIPLSSQCSLQIRPWGTKVPSCFFVNVDCNKLDVHGVSEEVVSMWLQLERSAIETLSILHCPTLELPPLLRDFSNLVSLKIYNSSIEKWDADAAISGNAHPHIAFINLVRVRFKKATLPEGLLSTDVPRSLEAVGISISNLRHIPNNLDLLWPSGMHVTLSMCDLDTVDEALIRLKPFSLSFNGNLIQTVPAALFEIEGLRELDLGNTSLEELPEQVDVLSSSLSFIYLSNTFVTTFWSWIDPLVLRSVDSESLAIIADGTPYCKELSLIMNGNASSFFTTNASSTTYSFLMDAEEYMSDIQQVLLCDPGFPSSSSTLAANA